MKYSENFQGFWKAYPPRISTHNRSRGQKGAAYEQWRGCLERVKAEKKLDDKAATLFLIDCAKRYAAVRPGEYRMDCYRWLRDDEWEHWQSRTPEQVRKDPNVDPLIKEIMESLK